MVHGNEERGSGSRSVPFWGMGDPFHLWEAIVWMLARISARAQSVFDRLNRVIGSE